MRAERDRMAPTARPERSHSVCGASAPRSFHASVTLERRSALALLYLFLPPSQYHCLPFPDSTQ